jgi:ABC-type dipeptide/oligopeptide/nickel transport system permease component
VISQTLPFTLQIAFLAFVISVTIGILLGVLAAQYEHRPLDTSIRVFYLAGFSSPPFFIGLLLLIAFAYELNVLPAGGAVDISLTPPTVITGLVWP